nr:unnamed protein product [Callosobruchus analis]
MEEDSGGTNRGSSTTTINDAEASNESMKERCLKLEKELSHQLSRRDEKKTIEELTQLVAAQQQQITELMVKIDRLLEIQEYLPPQKKADIKEELQQKGYAPLHIIRLKRSGAPMPLVVVVLPKLEKSRELFNEHELLGLAIRVAVQKNSRLIGQCHLCQKYGHVQSYCTAPPRCLKCASDHMTHLCPQTGLEERKCANCGERQIAQLADSPLGGICK